MFLFLAAFVFLAASCGKDPDDSKVLATVNGEKITEKAYEHYLQLRQPQHPPSADKEKEKRAVLDEMTDRILLTQHATRNKLDQDPEIYLLLKRVQENILVQAAIRKTLKDSPITEADLKKRFQEEAEKTHKTEYRVRHILVPTEADAARIIKQLQTGAGFAALARQKSVDAETGKNGGDLGWINQGMVLPELFNAVIAARKGAVVAAPVKTDYGWHVLRVDDARPLQIPTFEQFMTDRTARGNLERRMQDERINALLTELKAKAKIITD
ncbi:MAG: hypothetical protein A2637_07485 [Candidatus Muproteobacteria bacterium RIFCSPHIGHO2_01_FULL_65_16]|uniref:peptidylprolyl isomerase n=1 Tax=Candidatus Muproteobacteria bacterium RIFCSPHIGHO2_01_FULL_65_16 TaxID=1817764 RepID=A0A1F6TQA3_9PROT|nr:MAG: hypothetical protein A2637_07485 [Candidatus Muproteobacteria bacterium RIFCSPHIGHO2_01_FULL_65_16]